MRDLDAFDDAQFALVLQLLLQLVDQVVAIHFVAQTKRLQLVLRLRRHIQLVRQRFFRRNAAD